MIDLYIGNYEKVIGRYGYIKKDNNYMSCKIVGYLFRSRKYQVRTEDGKNLKVEKVYINF